MMTCNELREYQISEMAKAGACLSKQCRNPITKDQRATYIRFDEFCGRLGFAIMISVLNGEPKLIECVDSADLQQLYLNPHYKDQHLWSEEKWEKEIRRLV